jgi:hypothetical protein
MHAIRSVHCALIAVAPASPSEALRHEGSRLRRSGPRFEPDPDPATSPHARVGRPSTRARLAGVTVRAPCDATTAHHRLPSSQYPELFWSLTNLEASCGPCNAHGAKVKNENRINRMEIARLERVIENQQVEIAVLVERLSRYENGDVARTHAPSPKVH